MTRLIPAVFLLCVLTGCHPWVGKTQSEVMMKLGQPESIGTSGEYRVLAYHEEITWDTMDFLRSPRRRGINWSSETKSAYERFWIDSNGIVRKRTFTLE